MNSSAPSSGEMGRRVQSEVEFAKGLDEVCIADDRSGLVPAVARAQ